MDYYQRPEVSNSDLSKLKMLIEGKSIGNFEADLAEQFKIGNLVDALITEPELVNHYSRKLKGIEYTTEEFKHCIKMRDAFMSNSMCAMIHSHSKGQQTVIRNIDIEYEGTKFMLPARCRYDLFAPSIKMAGEIKTTVATSQLAFESSIPFMDYDRARAWYMDISQMDNEFIVGISKVNYKVFMVPVKRGDKIYTKGKEKYSYLAYQYSLLMQESK